MSILSIHTWLQGMVATHEEPGIGMMCDPSDETQAMASCAGVIPFLAAIAARASASSRFWFKFCIGATLVHHTFDRLYRPIRAYLFPEAGQVAHDTAFRDVIRGLDFAGKHATTHGAVCGDCNSELLGHSNHWRLDTSISLSALSKDETLTNIPSSRRRASMARPRFRRRQWGGPTRGLGQ